MARLDCDDNGVGACVLSLHSTVCRSNTLVSTRSAMGGVKPHRAVTRPLPHPRGGPFFDPKN